MNKNLKKISSLFYKMTIATLLIFSTTIPTVNALELEKTSTYAIEQYKKSINISCGNYGYIKVTATISHNMTTGRFTLVSAEPETHFNSTETGLYLTQFSTDPAEGKIITGKSIKVTVTYIKFGQKSYTKTDYIYL